MDKTIKRYTSLEAMKADSYRGWQALPASERIKAVSELTLALYALKGLKVFQDFKDLLSVFNAHGVKYLVIGGYAVSHHAEPRGTKDLDIWISPDLENCKAVHAALVEFCAPLGKLGPEDFTERDTFFRMGTPPAMVDIMSGMKGADFETAWQRRTNVEIDSTLTAPFISRTDLLAAKLAAGRPQDLVDVEALRAAESAQKGSSSDE